MSDDYTFSDWSRFAARLGQKLLFATGNHDEGLSCIPRGAKIARGEWLLEACDDPGPTICGPRTVSAYHYPPNGAAVCADIDDGDHLVATMCADGFGPAILLCGHVHTPRHWFDWLGDTLSINPGRADERDLIPRHVAINTASGIAALYDSRGVRDVTPLRARSTST